MASLCTLIAALAATAMASDSRTEAPVMGWNSYNYYGCIDPGPTEAIIKANAQGLVNHGFDKLGYKYVTADCGWASGQRDAAGRQVWNATRFPSGGQALGDYLHGLGLKFGIYSDAGYLMCGPIAWPGSLRKHTFSPFPAHG